MKKPHHRNGFALVVVLAIIALAAVLGYALLSAVSLSSQIDRNASSVNSSDTLAESGVELAMYYLQHPDKATSVNSSGFWAGGTNISLGDGLKLDRVTVQQTAPYTYSISSTATSGASRTINATVYVESKYEVKHALASNAGLDLSRATVTLTGTVLPVSIRVDGTLNLLSSLLATILSLGSNQTGWVVPPTYPVHAVPSRSELTLLNSMPYYTYNGKLCTADELTSHSLNALKSPDLVRNPANVWYTKNSINAGGTNIFDGTLVVMGDSSDMRVQGNLKITPKAGMPGLIASRELDLHADTSVLQVEGLVWVGRRIVSSGGSLLLGVLFKPKMQVNGALMIAGRGDDDADLNDATSNFRGTLAIIFTPDNLNLPDLSTVGQTPTKVRLLSWK